MSKKRKTSTSSSPVIKVEVKEENLYGDDVLIARGRLKGALQELVEQSDEDTGSSDDDSRRHRYRSPRKKDIDSSRYYTKVKRRRSDTSPAAAAAAFHHTYVMKLFDRSVDLARFEEDTPLYPICRAWMANQPRNPQAIIKRRTSSPDPDYEKAASASWNGDRLREIYQMPGSKGPPVSRVPSPLPEQLSQVKHDININYDFMIKDEKAPVPRDELIKNHLQRWAKVKQKWFTQANKNEERFEPSFNILTTIYNKAQENME